MAVVKTATEFFIGNLIWNRRFPGLYLIVGEYINNAAGIYHWIVLCPDEQLGHVAKCELEWEKVA